MRNTQREQWAEWLGGLDLIPWKRSRCTACEWSGNPIQILFNLIQSECVLSKDGGERACCSRQTVILTHCLECSPWNLDPKWRKDSEMSCSELTDIKGLPTQLYYTLLYMCAWAQQGWVGVWKQSFQK